MAKVEKRYIKNLNSDIIYNYSEILAERKDHVECDIKGNHLPEPGSAGAQAAEKKSAKEDKRVTRKGKAKKASDLSDVGEGAYSGASGDVEVEVE